MAKQVALKEEGALAIPAFMKDQIGLGTESLGMSDVETPRIKLMQLISPELSEIDGIKAGEFWHTLAERNLGNSVRVCPIYVDQRFLLWRPRNSGGGILARADDGIHWNPAGAEFDVQLKSGAKVKWRTAPTVAQSGLDKWGSENPNDPNSPPAATRMYCMVVTFPDHSDLPPAVVTLQRAAIKVARRFIGKMKITRAPSFGLVFEMKSTREKGTEGDFYNYAFTGKGLLEDEDTYRQNYELYLYFKAEGVKVKDLEGAQDGDIVASDKEAF